MREEYSCFLISAFGKKPLIRDPFIKADFDSLCEEIRESIIIFNNSHPKQKINVKRADDLTSGVISREVYYQLYNADIVIAEVSSLNLNVYYELGIRIALRKNITIILALNGTPLPFDLQDVRIIFYEPGELLKNKIQEFHRLIEERIKGEKDSPFHIAIPDIKMIRQQDFNNLKQQLDLFQGIYQKKTYGLKIDSPKEGTKVREWFNVSGSFIDNPPSNCARLLIKSTEGFGYWPQCIVKIDQQKKIWSGRCHLGAKAPEEGQIIIAVVGKMGCILWDYFMKVGNEVQKWPAIKNLPDDIFIVDKVNVQKPKNWFFLKP